MSSPKQCPLPRKRYDDLEVKVGVRKNKYLGYSNHSKVGGVWHCAGDDSTAFTEYAAGCHGVKTSWGEASESSEIQILHFPIRGFEKFEKKVKNVTAFFEANEHYETWWGWHWRRWIQLDQAGQLRAEYENQFVPADRARELISQGACSIDTTIADWRNRTQPSTVAGLLRRLTARFQ